MLEWAGVPDFHFLRPWSLVGVAAAVIIFLVVRRRFSLERQWRGIIAPHLLGHLKVGAEGGSRFRPVHLITVVILLGSVAVAGPTWKREVSPFAEDTAPLVIALDLSATMNAVDVQPSRLERAKQKIRDLLALRSGARTALVAYAGSAHTVLPLSDDPTLFETFLSDLTTTVMPVPGKDPSAALARADEMLTRDSVPGSILFLTDGIAEDAVPDFVEHQARTSDAVMVLAVGTSDGGPVRLPDGRFQTDAQGRRAMATLDRAGLEALAGSARVFVASSTVGGEDVERVQRRIQSHLQRVQQEDETARWRDEGYWLVWPVLILVALWFRRGWTVRWVTAVLALSLGACTPLPSERSAWIDLWLTPDQQGRSLFEDGRHLEAAYRFEDPMWRGLAYYRAGDLDSAVDHFARRDTPDANYNLANAYARLGSYEDALGAYDRALEQRSGWREAEENRALVASLIDPPEPADQQPPPGGDPTFDADQVEFDERGQQGERGEVEMGALSDEQIAEMWMRRLQTSPAEFLRQRFAIEVAQEEGGR